MIYAILSIALVVAVIFCFWFHEVNSDLKEELDTVRQYRETQKRNLDGFADSLRKARENLRAAEQNADVLALVFAHFVGELEKKTVINRLPLHFIKLVAASKQELAKHVERINLRHKPDQLARFDGSPEVPTQNATTTATPKQTRA